MRASGVKVERDLAEELPAISGNRGKLQQVLVNLILNARDALAELRAPSNHRSAREQVGREVELSRCRQRRGHAA